MKLYIHEFDTRSKKNVAVKEIEAVETLKQYRTVARSDYFTGYKKTLDKKELNVLVTSYSNYGMAATVPDAQMFKNKICEKMEIEIKKHAAIIKEYEDVINQLMKGEK